MTTPTALPPSPRRWRGFTLIEILIVVALVAVLTAIALPSYRDHVLRSQARGAATDLVAMGLALEGRFQRTLQYPTYAAGTVVPPLPASRTGSLATDFGTWAPAQSNTYAFTVQSAAAGYTLTATATGGVACTLTLTSGNVRTATGARCGFTTW